MSFIETLNRLMKDCGTSNVALGKAIGVSDVAVMRWRKGESGPSLENAVSIANYFGISLDDLVGIKQNVESTNFVRMPVIGEISAMGIYPEELWAADYIQINTDDLAGYPREECFSLAVQDSSLLPEYAPHVSYLIFHQQHQCADGDKVIVRTANTKELTFRTYHWSGENIVLASPVEGYKDLVYRKQDINKIRIEAVLIGDYILV